MSILPHRFTQLQLPLIGRLLPLGKPQLWAAGIIRTMGWVNDLDHHTTIGNNSMAWMVEVNALVIDVRHASSESREIAFQPVTKQVTTSPIQCLNVSHVIATQRGLKLRQPQYS